MYILNLMIYYSSVTNHGQQYEPPNNNDLLPDVKAENIRTKR